jgi:hypothetical protein
MEQVMVAAIRPNGAIEPVALPRPARHEHVAAEAMRQGYSEGNVGTSPRGYLTSTGRFVDREEGYRIAVLSGQIVRKAGSELFVPLLDTEDLW